MPVRVNSKADGDDIELPITDQSSGESLGSEMGKWEIGENDLKVFSGGYFTVN